MVLLVLWAKFLGAYIETPVEKQGYCKMNYGDEWRLTKGNNECYSYENNKKITHSFTEEEFKEQCSKPTFFSTTFHNDCFKNNKGDYIN